MTPDMEQLVLKGSCYCAPAIDLPSIVIFIAIGFVFGVLVGWEMGRDK